MFRVLSGIDLVSLDRLDGLKPEIRERFIKRALTPREMEDAAGIAAAGWQSIEILSKESGAPYVVLHGAALQSARQNQIFSWSVSITHEHTHAAAVAIALGGIPESEIQQG